jgi:hypothetical protein
MSIWFSMKCADKEIMNFKETEYHVSYFTNSHIYTLTHNDNYIDGHRIDIINFKC